MSNDSDKTKNILGDLGIFDPHAPQSLSPKEIMEAHGRREIQRQTELEQRQSAQRVEQVAAEARARGEDEILAILKMNRVAAEPRRPDSSDFIDKSGRPMGLNSRISFAPIMEKSIDPIARAGALSPKTKLPRLQVTHRTYSIPSSDGKGRTNIITTSIAPESFDP